MEKLPPQRCKSLGQPGRTSPLTRYMYLCTQALHNTCSVSLSNQSTLTLATWHAPDYHEAASPDENSKTSSAGARQGRP